MAAANTTLLLSACQIIRQPWSISTNKSIRKINRFEACTCNRQLFVGKINYRWFIKNLRNNMQWNWHSDPQLSCLHWLITSSTLEGCPGEDFMNNSRQWHHMYPINIFHMCNLKVKTKKILTAFSQPNRKLTNAFHCPNASSDCPIWYQQDLAL